MTEQKKRWRFRNGLGIDNNDEEYDRQRDLEEKERVEMQREDDYMKALMKAEAELRRLQQTKGDLARRERLLNERNSRLWKLVVKQRKEDRERRKDVEDMTLHEREQENNRLMQLEDGLSFMSGEMDRVFEIRRQCLHRHHLRLEKIANEERVIASIAAEEKAERLKLESIREAAEIENMRICDMECAWLREEEKNIEKKRAIIKNVLTPFKPYYVDNSDDNEEAKSTPWLRNEIIKKKK